MRTEFISRDVDGRTELGGWTGRFSDGDRARPDRIACRLRALLQHLRRLLVPPQPLNLPAHSIRSYLRKIHSDVHHQSCTYGDGAPLATVNIAVAVFCAVDTTSGL